MVEITEYYSQTLNFKSLSFMDLIIHEFSINN